MNAGLATLEFQNRKVWRTWLAKHHSSSPGIWVVFYKEQTGIETLGYEDSVREALCFGWIDSLIKRLDDRRYARKFTPRQPESKWSNTNRKRWAELQEAGLLAQPGLDAAPTDNKYAPRPEIPELPSYIAETLETNPAAWNVFRQLSPSHRRQYVLWIHSVKRPETREKRMRESIALLSDGQKLGLK